MIIEKVHRRYKLYNTSGVVIFSVVFTRVALLIFFVT
jgi:hypothetical protein